MMVVQIVMPTEGEESACVVTLRDEDGKLMQRLRISESIESWDMLVTSEDD